jgi:hypothetical protein
MEDFFETFETVADGFGLASGVARLFRRRDPQLLDKVQQGAASPAEQNRAKEIVRGEPATGRWVSAGGGLLFQTI